MRKIIGAGMLAVVLVLVGPPGQAAAFHGSVTVVATVRVFPLVLTADEPAEVTVGERFTLEVRVRNLASQPLLQGVATITFDGTKLELSGPAEKTFGAVNNRKIKDVQWRFMALAVGEYELTVHVQALDQETTTTVEQETTLIVRVVTGGSPPGSNNGRGNDPSVVPPFVLAGMRQDGEGIRPASR